jgi:hypothetical protein
MAQTGRSNVRYVDPQRSANDSTPHHLTVNGLYFGDGRTFRRPQMPFSGVCFKAAVYTLMQTYNKPPIIGTSKLTRCGNIVARYIYGFFGSGITFEVFSGEQPSVLEVPGPPETYVPKSVCPTGSKKSARWYIDDAPPLFFGKEPLQ